jgi:methylthioribose-1-phosphate isomerase
MQITLTLTNTDLLRELRRIYQGVDPAYDLTDAALVNAILTEMLRKLINDEHKKRKAK